MKTPWQIAEKGDEYSHQVALFAWCAMAARFGIANANEPYSYSGNVNFEYGSLARAASDKVPELQWLFAIKNAGHGDAIRGARSSAEGVRSGVPDICLPVPQMPIEGATYGFKHWYKCGLYIELKRPNAIGKSKGHTSEAQNKWIDYLRNAGYAVEVCYGWEEARDWLLKYLGK